MIVQKQQDILATPKSAYITKIEILDRLSATDSIQSIYRNGIELVNFGNYNIDRLYIDTTCEPATKYTYSLYVNGSEVCSTTVTTPDTTQKYVNQVQLGNETLMDITDSTVTPETLLEGEMAYNAAGEFIIGTAKSGTALETCTVTITGSPNTSSGTGIVYTTIENGFPKAAYTVFQSGESITISAMKGSAIAIIESNGYQNDEYSGAPFIGECNIYTTNAVYEAQRDGSIIEIYCFIRNTPILMANGTAKMVQDITYDDELLVWDFDNGCFTTSKPLWIKKAEKCDYYYRCEFDNGSVLNLAGSNGKCHRLFSVDDNCFLSATDCVGKNIMTDNGVVKLLSCERVDETVDFYNIVTGYHFNLYANNILTSTSLNNLYPIENMKFVKEDREIIPFEVYKDIPEMFYKGLRLGERKPEEVEHINDYVLNMIKKQLQI